jgi:hypothetical protein
VREMMIGDSEAFYDTEEKVYNDLSEDDEVPEQYASLHEETLVDHPLASRIHIRNTFIYHIFNVSPGTGNSGWAGAAWLRSGHDGHDDLRVGVMIRSRIGVVMFLIKLAATFLSRAFFSARFFAAVRFLAASGYSLARGTLFMGEFLACALMAPQSSLDSLLLSVDTILLGNLHHLILLVETALLRTELEITRLVYRYEYWSHCLSISRENYWSLLKGRWVS